MTKYWLVEVMPAREKRRRRKGASMATDMSMPAWPSIDPARPRSACARAASTMRRRIHSRNSSATSTIMIGPATNSARVNCQPMPKARIRPSSTTRLVDAISNTIAEVRLAPRRSSARARATAA